MYIASVPISRSKDGGVTTWYGFVRRIEHRGLNLGKFVISPRTHD